MLSAAIGAILGNISGYAVGRLVGETVLARHGWRIGLNGRRLALGRYMFARHGGKMIFFSRFAALLRSFFSALLAGANMMKWRPFLLWSVVGGFAWPSLSGFGVFLLGNAAKRLSGPASIAFGITAAARHSGRSDPGTAQRRPVDRGRLAMGTTVAPFDTRCIRRLAAPVIARSAIAWCPRHRPKPPAMSWPLTTQPGSRLERDAARLVARRPGLRSQG